MKIIIILILQLLAFIPFFNMNIDCELLSWAFILINSLIIIIFCTKNINSDISLVIITSFFLRIVLVVIDLYTSINLLHSGADSEGFNRIALHNSLIGSYELRRTFFTDYLTFIYYLWGQQRLLAQYINVVMGVSTIYVCYQIFTLLKLKFSIIKRTIIVLSFYPTLLLMSSILLRDMIVICFTTYSLYYFLNWCLTNRLAFFSFAMINLFIASIMHPGVLLIGIGYIIAFVLWDFEHHRVKMTVKSILSLFPIFVFVLIIIAFPTLFMDKFVGISEEGDIAKSVTYEGLEAGSRYLEWIQPSGIIEMLLYTPIKVLYFYISPVPWNIRGVGDVLSFLIDSSLYVFLFYKIINKIKKKKSFFCLSLCIGLLISSIAFAWGVVAAGTAMRHRVKLLVLIIIIYFCTNFKTSISK